MSLVDFVMALLISLFAALSTGGAVVAGQYLGGRNVRKANDTVNQLVWFTGAVSIAVMGIVYCLKNVILRGLFGEISPDVYMHANTYLLIVAGSIPFIALYSSGAAIFRTMRNSRLPMNIMIVMNIIHIGLNALLVYGLGMGTEGVAVSSLVSRIGAVVILLVYCLDSNRLLHVSRTLRHRFDGEAIRRILGIGLPYGFENGMFYLGRLVILSLVATFGTAAIAANAVSGTIVMFQVLPGMAIGLGMTVVISRCVGAGDYALASVLSLNPDVLVLDEPLNSLDPKTKKFLSVLLLELKGAGKTIIASIHDFSHLDGVFDRAIVLSGDHRIVRSGSYCDVVGDTGFLTKQNII